MAYSVSNQVKQVKYYRKNGDTIFLEHPETDGEQCKLTTTENGITQTNAQDELVAVHAKINALNTTVNNTVAGIVTCHVVADIAARNALTGLKVGDQAFVLDATADTTVARGGAKYIVKAMDGTTPTWHKTSEDESLDVVIDWSNIQNKESSVMHVSTLPESMPEGLAEGGLLVVG